MSIKFYTAGKTVDPDLFDGIAKSIAKSFVSNAGGKKIGVSKTQMRRLYDEVKRFEQSLDGNSDKWIDKLPYIRKIKALASYSIARSIEKNRDSANCYKELLKFINEGIQQVQDENDYRVFVSLFEAVYGFYYEISPKES